MVAFYKIKRKRANVKFKTSYFSTKLCVKFSYQLFDIFLFNYFIFVRMLVLFSVLCLFLCMCERESERERERERRLLSMLPEIVFTMFEARMGKFAPSMKGTTPLTPSSKS